MGENKTVTLDDFTAEMVQRVVDFKEYWIGMHGTQPQDFPMQFDGDNAGIWYEMFANFDEELSLQLRELRL